MRIHFAVLASIPYHIPVVRNRIVLLLLSHRRSSIDLVFLDGWPATLIILLYLELACLRALLSETSWEDQYANRVEHDRREPRHQPKLEMLTQLISSDIWSYSCTRSPRLPPGTTCLLPNGRLLRRPSHICALGQDQTLGNIPKTLGLKNCDAMQLPSGFAAQSHHYLLSWIAPLGTTKPSPCPCF